MACGRVLPVVYGQIWVAGGKDGDLPPFSFLGAVNEAWAWQPSSTSETKVRRMSVRLTPGFCLRPSGVFLV